jgi:hypothetical protein
MSASTSVGNAIIKLFRGGGVGTNFTAPSLVWAQPHIGDPGLDGTSNQGGERTRQPIVLTAPASKSATLASTGTWTNVASTEVWSYVSYHTSSNSSLGYCIGSGPITPEPLSVIAAQTWSLTALTVTVD